MSAALPRMYKNSSAWAVPGGMAFFGPPPHAAVAASSRVSSDSRTRQRGRNISALIASEESCFDHPIVLGPQPLVQRHGWGKPEVGSSPRRIRVCVAHIAAL